MHRFPPRRGEDFCLQARPVHVAMEVLGKRNEPHTPSIEGATPVCAPTRFPIGSRNLSDEVEPIGALQIVSHASYTGDALVSPRTPINGPPCFHSCFTRPVPCINRRCRAHQHGARPCACKRGSELGTPRTSFRQASIALPAKQSSGESQRNFQTHHEICNAAHQPVCCLNSPANRCIEKALDPNASSALPPLAYKRTLCSVGNRADRAPVDTRDIRYS
jgi:hypothetical protein